MSRSDATFVSTGSLPAAAEVRRLVDEAYLRYLPVRDGAVSSVYPALGTADPGHFGVVVAASRGRPTRRATAPCSSRS
jgi:glutaminase